MKYIYIILIFVFFIGCSENPVNSPITETDKSLTPQRFIFEIVQYYTCQDSVCPPDLTLLRVDITETSGFSDSRRFFTMDSVIIFEGKKFYSDSFIIWFNGHGTITVNNQTFTIRQWGYEYISLYCNRKYSVQFEIN